MTPEGFYRDLVWNLRNGVLAVTRDGRVAVMNDVAYRILGLKPAHDRHRPPVHARSCKDVPDVSRIVAERLRAVAPAEPRRAAAEDDGQGDRLHAVAGPRRATAA